MDELFVGCSSANRVNEDRPSRRGVAFVVTPGFPGAAETARQLRLL